jgi:hypothetical protein
MLQTCYNLIHKLEYEPVAARVSGASLTVDAYNQGVRAGADDQVKCK